MTRREEPSEAWRAIRKVLMEKWDPLDVKNEPMARDEYDNYISDVYALLVSGASDEMIANRLRDIAEGPMGGDCVTKSAMAETIEALRKIPLGDPKN
jgi:hypothetical protein